MIAAAPPPAAYVWSHPGRAPYMGSFDQAVAAFAIPPPARPMRCSYRDIWQGERFAAMMFGRDRVEYNVVADADEWPAGDTRVADDCWYLDGGWEYHLVRPLVCGNWALEVLPIAGWWPYPGDAALRGRFEAAEYGGEGIGSGDTLGWGAYGLPGGYGVPVSYEVPPTAISAPGGVASGFAGIPGFGSSEYPSGAGGSGAGGRVAVPEPSGIVALLFALTVWALSYPKRAAVVDPEPKPPEALRGNAVDGAGSSSETNARQSHPAAGGRSWVRGEDDGQTRASAAEAGGNPALGLLAMLGLRRRATLRARRLGSGHFLKDHPDHDRPV